MSHLFQRVEFCRNTIAVLYCAKARYSLTRSLFLCRYGSGFNLQAKVKLSPPETTDGASPTKRKRFSLRRQGSSFLRQFSFRRQRSSVRQEYTGRQESISRQFSFSRRFSLSRQTSRISNSSTTLGRSHTTLLIHFTVYLWIGTFLRCCNYLLANFTY